MLKEFRDFIARGNVIDLAVGIIIGAAFTGVVQSLVKDIVNPVIALFSGGIDLSGWFYVLGGGEYASAEAAREAGAPVLALGGFLMAVINFLIVAAVVFALVKSVNRLREMTERKAEPQPEPEPEPQGPTEIELLTEIRDALRK